MEAEQKEMTAAEMAAKENYPLNKGIGFPASSVQDGMKRLIAEGKVDEDGADAIYWLFQYAQEKGLGYEGCGAALGISGTTVFHLFHADYNASYAKMVQTILRFKKIEEERSKTKSLGFVKTWTAEQVFTVCDAALYDGMPAFIYGSSQTGKTTALEEYQKTHNHGTTKYVRMGVRWNKRRLVRKLAQACKCFSETAHGDQLEERIMRSVTDRMLLIVDEFHLALETTTDLAAKEIVEFIREIYDRTHCGLVVCGTKVAETGLESGRNMLLFDQLRRRGLVKLVLPDVPRKTDVNRFAREFSLPAPTGELFDTIKVLLKRYGLGMYVKYLRKADALARNAGEAVTWDHFKAVSDGYANLARIGNEY